MNKNTKQFAKIASVIATIIGLLMPTGLANAATLSLDTQSQNSQLSAFDTVSNFETVITVTGQKPQKVVAVALTKPDGTTFTQKAVADTKGKALLTIPETQTQRAGNYAVMLEGTLIETSFTVFPGEVNAEKSGIFVSKSTATANAADPVRVTVRVVDEFLNPLAFHQVHLTSSRPEDRVTAQDSETNTNGLATFSVTSSQLGSCVLTAVDETTGTVFTARPKILFAGSSFVSKDIGGDPETVLLADSGVTIAKYRIDNLPASVAINDTISFTVTAVDSNGATVPSYTKTITFTSTDPNAKMPNPYTFKPNDQGTMTFNVALSFATSGTQTLTVQEQGNPLIKGQKNVEVSKSHAAADGQVRITKPATGTYSLNTLEVAGEAPLNSKVRIMDNGQQITEVQSNGSGRFTYTTSLLTDGNHTFQAESNGVQSAPVTITIDSTPAQIQQVDITKQELAPGESTTVTVRSDPNLNKVQLEVNNVVTDMEEDPQNPGVYKGNITAPLQDGEYPVHVVITDNVGNISPAAEIGKLHIDATLITGTASFSVPSSVKGLKATPGNSKITLSWIAAEAEQGIALYRIYYGTNPQDLNLIVATKDAKISFDVTGLQNGTPYYFQVTGVDTQGNESDNPGEIVSGVPTPTTGVSATGIGIVCDPSPCPQSGPPSTMPQDGPALEGMLLASLLGSGVWNFVRRKRQH